MNSKLSMILLAFALPSHTARQSADVKQHVSILQFEAISQRGRAAPPEPKSQHAKPAPPAGCCCLMTDAGPPPGFSCSGYKEGDEQTEGSCRDDAKQASTEYKWHAGKCKDSDESSGARKKGSITDAPPILLLPSEVRLTGLQLL